ncbi:uncharacterized protein LOC111049758 [Nilaparvata lugens]|uniref:uncharacterized protein LOC111049758 n=1 Tax=Nilaparvata lugens TaxID=108931 RepID=UPI00193C96D0|nr:uncharacterized protein LOC111049758 [Nilaparvata lugens]
MESNRDEDDIGLSDVVSVIISSEDGQYLLVSDETKHKGLFWIFTKSARNKTFRSAAGDLLAEKFHSNFNSLREHLLKFYNVWVPDDNSLHHAVFEMIISDDQKNSLKMENKMWKGSWCSKTEIKSMAISGTLRSPELLDYIASSQSVKKKQKSTEKPSSGQDKNHSTLSNATVIDNLTEINRSHLVIETNKDPQNPQEVTVKQACLNFPEQMMIYREFLSLCFPNLLMNSTIFESFMISFGWDVSLTKNLFRAADVTNRGAITHKEFLFILAACEPRTPHAGKPAETRCRYIFRFFDTTNSNRLSFDDLKRMLLMIRETRGQSQNEIEVEKELDNCEKTVQNISITDMTLGNFMRCIGELKFRGTSKLLRSPISVIQFFRSRNIESYWSVIDAKASLLFRDNHSNEPSTSTHQMNSRIMLPSSPSNIMETGYRLCGHVFSVSRLGVQDILTVDKLPCAKSDSLQQACLTRESIERLKNAFLPNEVLSGLAYFAEKIDATDVVARKAGRKPKLPFNWGQIDMVGLGIHLIQLCKIVSEIFAREPRLLRIKSPVYVLAIDIFRPTKTDDEH